MANWKHHSWCSRKAELGNGGLGHECPYIIKTSHFFFFFCCICNSKLFHLLSATIKLPSPQCKATSGLPPQVKEPINHRQVEHFSIFTCHFQAIASHRCDLWSWFSFQHSPAVLWVLRYSPPKKYLKTLRKMSLGLITPSPSYSLILSINTSIILAFSLTQIKRRASNYFTVPSPFPTQAFCLTQWQSTTSQILKRLRYFRYAVGMRGLK